MDLGHFDQQVRHDQTIVDVTRVDDSRGYQTTRIVERSQGFDSSTSESANLAVSPQRRRDVELQ